MGFLCAILDQHSSELPHEGWAFLRSNKLTKHLGDAKPPVYQAVLTAVDRAGVDLDLLPNHSVKTIYAKLIPPTPPAVGLCSPVGMEVCYFTFMGQDLGQPIWWSQYEQGKLHHVADRSRRSQDVGVPQVLAQTGCE